METQEVTDSLPKAQSKSGSTQLDGPGMVSSANIPEVLTEDMVCDTVMPPVSVSGAASLELPLNVEEAPLIREESNRTSHDADAILVQEFSSRFPDHASILDIQGSARSDQVTCCFLKTTVTLCWFQIVYCAYELDFSSTESSRYGLSTIFVSSRPKYHNSSGALDFYIDSFRSGSAH